VNFAPESGTVKISGFYHRLMSGETTSTEMSLPGGDGLTLSTPHPPLNTCPETKTGTVSRKSQTDCPKAKKNFRILIYGI
jgi:hypothetical protein